MRFTQKMVSTPIAVVAAACLFVCMQASAAPSVSGVGGDVSHGGTLVVSGSGFGTRAHAAPLRHDDFEDGTDGALLNSTGYWHVSSNNPTIDKPQYSGDAVGNRHAHSALSAKFIMYGIQDMAYTPDLGMSGRHVYIDLWQWFQWGSLDQQHQIKMFKIQSIVNDNGSADPASHPILNFYSWRYNGGGKSCYLPFSNTDGMIVQPYIASMSDTAAWYHWQVEILNNDTGSSNGELRVWRDHTLMTQHGNLEIRLAGDNNFRSVWLGRYMGNYTGDLRTTLYYDDVYLDDSWARVEIGDAPTWSACTHRETQASSAWSDGSVTVTVNQGSFANGQGAYLFVVDADGVAGAGFPVTIGGPVAHHLTVTNGSGSGDYEEGQVVAVAADPPTSGKAFAAWMGDFAYVADRTAAQTTVTMPARDASLTAAYVWVYRLTVNSGSGGGDYPAGTVVAVEADAAPAGRRFEAWTGDTAGMDDAAAASTTIDIPSHPVAITATYAATNQPGDLSGDGFVGQADLDIVLANWGCGGEGGEPLLDARADASGDGFVGQADLDIVLAHWGQGTLPQ
jgi:hypothetical protein